jgi:glycosyltransferase involved in cell wall biosynthesis
MTYYKIEEKIYKDTIPEFSIILPVHNQENIIIAVLNGIVTNTLGIYEFIIILDACYDNTDAIVKDWFNNFKQTTNIMRVVIFKTEYPLFETKCDNIGFKNSNGKYLLEIQADMIMTELGYNIHLQKPFKILNNVIAVSGRCCHNIKDNDGFGKLGGDIIKNVTDLPRNINKNTFYVAESCNRGPLLLDADKLKQLDYLDEINYFQDNSDHDLMVRAYYNYKWICGYVPIDYKTDLSWGITRRPRNQINSYLWNKRKEECNENLFIEKYYNQLETRKIYTIPI